MEPWMQPLIQIKSFLLTVLEQVLLLAGAVQPVVKKILIVMLGGGVGAAIRYSIGLLTAKAWGTQFPWGTLMVNLTGCFFIGLIFALAERVRLLTPDMRLLLITGFLGALTTFSAFSLETVNAGRAGLTLQPVVNILANNLGGIALTFVGLWLGGLK